MTNLKHIKRALCSSVIALLVCFTMLLGTTFAWFTDYVNSDANVIQTGKLDVGMYWAEGSNAVPTDDNDWNDASTGAIFNNDKWEPGYVEAKHIKITNEGTLALKYKLLIVPNGEVDALADVIDVYFIPMATQLTDRSVLTDTYKVGTLRDMIEDIDGAAYGAILPVGATVDALGENEVIGEVTATIALKMSENAGNEYKGMSIGSNFAIQLLATQYTFEEDSFDNQYDKDAEYPVIPMVDKWDGTVDTSWYNDTDTEFALSSSEQLAGLAELVDAGNDFAGKTIKLDADMDLYVEDENGEPISFEPIGSFSDNVAFDGTFDGQGHTISNLYQSGWALQNGYWDGPEYGMGLFSLVENASIKNINFDGASLPSEANIMGIVAGGAANCVFENISVTDAYLGNHSWYSGGFIGWAEGDVKLINCDIDASSVVSSQWGDFNNANGGLIGGIASTSAIYLKDCDVACVIDAYNDVTSAYEWYSYRSCGMLIGDTGQRDDPDGDNVGNAIAPNVTCENVTVTYGDWANYHYCQFNSSNYPFCRVEAGESTGAYGNARVGEYYDANGNKVVDDNHVHNEGEKHNELIVFDQLYGGKSGDRYCTYGTATHEGVTVIYNNK